VLRASLVATDIHSTRLQRVGRFGCSPPCSFFTWQVYHGINILRVLVWHWLTTRNHIFITITTHPTPCAAPTPQIQSNAGTIDLILCTLLTALFFPFLPCAATHPPQIQRDAARVLTSASTPDQPVIRVVRSNEIQRGVKTRNLVTTDKHNNQVCGWAVLRSSCSLFYPLSHTWRPPLQATPLVHSWGSLRTVLAAMLTPKITAADCML
jgi:hypothetical protein